MIFSTAILVVLVLALFADLFVPLILGFKYPGYNHFHDTISTLGTSESPVRTQENLNLILVGILFIVFALGQRFVFSYIGWSHNLYIAGIISFGIGCIVAGIFPEDSKGAIESASGKIHGIFSGLGFIMLVLNPLWATFIADFSEFRIINILFFVSGLITFVLFIVSGKKESGFIGFTGLFQRLNLIALYACLIVNYTATMVPVEGYVTQPIR